MKRQEEGGGKVDAARHCTGPLPNNQLLADIMFNISWFKRPTKEAGSSN